MKIHKFIITGLVAGALALTSAWAAPASQQLQQGLYAEEVEGNLASAIQIYAGIIADTSAPPNLAAQALYRQGMCYLRLKDDASGKAALEKLVADYPTQTDLVAKGRLALEDLNDFDPASLMPAGTLVYLEFGSPGRQIETVLNTLKGTPFENPLAAMAPQQATNPGGPSPQNLVASLLNPSMIAEFKKIHSSAIGITGIEQNNPPMVAVLYPGKSDALRGIIQAALGMAGAPGEPIEGMQTVNIQGFGQVAFDDRVVIAARPATQLPWCVKQYKGVTTEPSLASTSSSFKRLGKTQRLNNLLTLWANVDAAYAQVLKMFPEGHVPAQLLAANALVDFANVDDLTITHSLQTNGVSSRIELQFKDGHHSLAYDLIRTPNISRAGLAAVPAGAIGVVSFALGSSNSIAAQQIQSRVQDLTGLDIGREIFANIEQVTLFAMPIDTASESKSFLPGHLGLALTSRNPAQTRQILETAFGTVSKMSGGDTAASGPFKLGKVGGRELNLYIDQVDETTALSMNQDIVHAAIAAAKNHASICDSGPLSHIVSQLPPTASKWIALNAGGVIRLASPLINPGGMSDAQASQWHSNLDQLATAEDAATLEIRTEEEPNSLALNSTAAGLPPVAQILGPVSQLIALGKHAAQETTAKALRQEAAAVIMPAAKAPALDGSVSDLWQNARQYKLENVIYDPLKSPNDLSGNFRALWDASNLYILVDVTDDILNTNPNKDDWYQSDGVEVYIDGDDAKAPQYGQNDYQYAFIWDKASPQIRETKHNRTNGVEYVFVKTDAGYRVQAKFPWTTIGVKPSAGAKIGLDVHINDNDSGKRDHKLTWHDGADNAYQSPQAFGNAQLAGLLGWWKFDEGQGATAADSSGNNHPGALVGNAKWAQGKLGGAIDLDGNGSYVQIADKSAFDMAGEATVACWVNIRSIPAEWTGIVTKGDTSWRLSTVEQKNQFHFAANDYEIGHDNIFVNAATTVAPQTWHHVVGTYDGANIRIYVDGQLDGTKAWTGGIGKNDVDVLIGENAGKKGRSFDGLIDDVRIYNYALPEAQIKEMSAAQTAGSR